MKKIGLIIFVSLIMTLLSGFYQRPGNEIWEWSNMCHPEDITNCYGSTLSGGFPVAFIFDMPGISVENSLFTEDDFRWLPFLVDCWFYSIMLISSYVSVKSYTKIK